MTRGASSAWRDTESEEQFTDWFVETATLLGWRVIHHRPARTQRGWRTATQGHKGFPDIVAARDGVIVCAELKSSTGRPSPDQRAWLDALGGCAHLWRPADRDAILAVLSAPRLAVAAAPVPQRQLAELAVLWRARRDDDTEPHLRSLVRVGPDLAAALDAVADPQT